MGLGERVDLLNCYSTFSHKIFLLFVGKSFVVNVVCFSPQRFSIFTKWGTKFWRTVLFVSMWTHTSKYVTTSVRDLKILIINFHFYHIFFNNKLFIFQTLTDKFNFGKFFFDNLSIIDISLFAIYLSLTFINFLLSSVYIRSTRFYLNN